MRIPLALLPIILACAHIPALPPAPEADYSAGVESASLQDIVDRHWAWTLQTYPEFATRLGDHSGDDRLTDPRWSAARENNQVRKAFLARLRSLEDLSEQDRVTRDLLVEELVADIESEVCKFPLWSLSPRSNPITQINYLPQGQPLDTPVQMKALLARYAQAAVNVRMTIDNLEQGAAKGWFANEESARRVSKMVRSQLDAPIESWPMVEDARADVSWPRETRERLDAELMRVVTEDIAPALRAYGAFIDERVLPNARGPKDGVGLSGLPFGDSCYAARISSFTTIDTDARTIHETGLEEIERINGEMRALGQELFGTGDLAEILVRLRTDPSLYFNSGPEIVDKAEAALASARSVLPAFFGRLPEAECVVKEIPEYEAPFTTVAYYRQPVPDGSEPGAYFVNTYAPETRTRYEAEALAFHESIPGHHLQIAIAQELSDVPEFRKHLGMTVFVEGWALYSERLSKEMGLYSGPLDEMGMLSYEAWRAARLVVDTGLHAMGWTREQAKAFMAEHTALALNNIDNEVDRYIVWPGQALAYKTGQMEIARLRAQAKERLGARFSLPAFHDAILLGGAVSIPVLRQRVDAWIASVEAN